MNRAIMANHMINLITSYFRLFAYCIVSLFYFSSSCCQFLWIVNFWFPLRYSLNVYLPDTFHSTQKSRVHTDLHLWLLPANHLCENHLDKKVSQNTMKLILSLGSHMDKYRHVPSFVNVQPKYGESRLNGNEEIDLITKT